jgi:DNA-directed RNA polymerase subunit RPC12/RpoP
MDIFDAKILCKNCGKEMKKTKVLKNGFELRAVECPMCKERIVHPSDKGAMDHFKDLKGKNFNVKLRVVGNSHAVSIPKEIINFMNEMHRDMKKDMDDMVRLCFEDFGKLSLNFGDLHHARRRDLRWRDR